MKTSLRVSILLLLAFIFFLSSVPGVQAEEMTAPKQETVYTVLNAAGDVEKILVVNQFHLAEPGTIHDYGNYTQVSRLTGEAEIARDGELISAEVPAGEWYYEGEMAGADLPWLFELRFSLDGEAIDPALLSGANGQLAIDVKVKPNPACPEHFRQSFFLQIMLPIESAKATEIHSNAVFTTSGGKNQILNWLVLPGQEQELNMTANVQDFALAAPQIAGLPISFDASAMQIGEEEIKMALDQSGSLNQIRELESAVAQFDDGAKTLKESSAKIKEAIEKMDAGLSEMNSSEQLKAIEPVLAAVPALSQLIEGGKELAKGVSTLKEGYTKFHQGLSDYTEGMSKFRKGVDGMEEALPSQLQNALGSLFPPYKAESFVSPRNDQVHSVQFVFTWPAIPAAN